MALFCLFAASALFVGALGFAFFGYVRSEPEWIERAPEDDR